MAKIYYELDDETGELTPVKDVLVPLKHGDRIYHKENIEYAKIQYAAKNDNGNFIWILFKYGEELFPNLSAANLTRLIYAVTFCDQDGFIMSKQELKNRMNLNRSRWSDFWNEATQDNILYEDNGDVYVNQDMFCNGRITTTSNYTRLFCEYIQQLYEQCNSADAHKQLSYLFKIIPFVNRRTNIVCFNPTEQNEENIRFMRLGDFCEALGYERKNARRLAKDLLKIRINNELAIGFFVTDMSEDKWTMVINPKLYFGGKYDTLFKKYRNLFAQEAKEYQALLTQQND